MKIIAASLSALFAGTSLVQAAGFELLKPHRAVYEVKLENAEERSGIVGMNGRIVYEVSGNECEGIAVNYRFVTRINTGREQFVTDQQTSTHESPDGKEFSFQTKSFVNEAPDQKIIGNARRTDDGLQVELGQGDKRELKLDDAIFTTTHLVNILSNAKEGIPFLRHDVFDGSGDADKVLGSASVIGKAKTYGDVLENENADAVEPLLEKQAWPVTMSYFKNDLGNGGEAVPIYEASFYLYGDGITRQLSMRYQDYTLLATLSELEYYDPTPCLIEN